MSHRAAGTGLVSCGAPDEGLWYGAREPWWPPALILRAGGCRACRATGQQETCTPDLRPCAAGSPTKRVWAVEWLEATPPGGTSWRDPSIGPPGKHFLLSPPFPTAREDRWGGKWGIPTAPSRVWCATAVPVPAGLLVARQAHTLAGGGGSAANGDGGRNAGRGGLAGGVGGRGGGAAAPTAAPFTSFVGAVIRQHMSTVCHATRPPSSSIADGRAVDGHRSHAPRKCNGARGGRTAQRCVRRPVADRRVGAECGGSNAATPSARGMRGAAGREADWEGGGWVGGRVGAYSGRCEPACAPEEPRYWRSGAGWRGAIGERPDGGACWSLGPCLVRFLKGRRERAVFGGRESTGWREVRPATHIGSLHAHRESALPFQTSAQEAVGPYK